MLDMDGLDLAKKILKKDKRTNIIFITEHDEYALDAYKLCASVFLTKPIMLEDIRDALIHLRNPIDIENKKIVAKCFGIFEVFIYNKAIKFK